jgi:hypothetical protein
MLDGRGELSMGFRFATAVLVICIIGRVSLAYAAELRCELQDQNGKCVWAILQGPILPEPTPGQRQPAAPQWTRDNPLVPKTQADANNAPAGSYIKDPKTGSLFIRTGDYETVQTFFRKSWPALTMIELISDGGSAYEGMKIGRLMRKYLITSYVPRGRTKCGSTGCVCASACALIWFGGVERLGVVGLHRPRFEDPDFASQPPEEATKLYRRVLNDIESYLGEMEVPRPIIQAMVATSSSEIRWVDAIADQLSRPPSYAEWEDASCREKYDPEQGPLIDECRGSLRSSRIKQLSPP